ncbi:MAG: A/G-specific adenine glycosylase [Hyphomicrobiales bacterium]|nr:MAG: A/G-specific adenine glycosylase [Hyphomicrobiales bacterium]
MIKPSASPRKRAAALLAWYDAHRRDLPWRARPGERADPYAVWLSEIMLQQTTVAAVKGYYETFLARWPTVEALAAAPLDEVLAAWAGLGYYARARNLHACAGRIARDHGGRFPRSEAALRSLPGVGPYTAGAIAAIAFDAPAAAVDGNVERVMARLHAIAAPLRQAKPRVRELAEAMLPAARAGDFAQALMDLGATVCTPRAPKCGACPLSTECAAYAADAAEAYPVKEKKAGKPKRRGAIFILRRGDCALVVRRPAKGLFGGMTAFPATPFDRDAPPEAWLDFAPCPAKWRALPETVAHVFTHFALDATVFVAQTTSARPAVAEGRWAARGDLDKEGLPTLMRKAAAAAGLL